MARFKERPYTLYPRTLADATVWYFYSYDAEGRRLPAKSTGIGFSRERDRAKSRREAEAKLDELAERGELGRVEGVTLAAWIASRHFWNFRRSTYVRAILARSSKEKPGITESYCKTADQITRDHILPEHGEKPIEKITPYDCEQILFRWQAKGSNKTANNWKSVYSTILGEYERELKMRDPKADFFNPWRMVMPLAVDKNKFGALTISEVMRIVSPAAFDAKGAVYYLASKLAFLAGLRIAEVCGLYTDDVKDIEVARGEATARLSYLEVKYQWNQKVRGRTLVKDKEIRRIPVSAELRDEMGPFLSAGPGRFVFSFHPRQETPLTANRLREWLYRHMEAQGISPAAREERNITFHSARRFFNTLLRHEKVADSIIRRFTGHDSDEMTEHYTDYLPEDMQEISRAQSRLLLGEIRE